MALFSLIKSRSDSDLEILEEWKNEWDNKFDDLKNQYPDAYMDANQNIQEKQDVKHFVQQLKKSKEGQRLLWKDIRAALNEVEPHWRKKRISSLDLVVVMNLITTLPLYWPHIKKREELAKPLQEEISEYLSQWIREVSSGENILGQENATSERDMYESINVKSKSSEDFGALSESEYSDTLPIFMQQAPVNQHFTDEKNRSEQPISTSRTNGSSITADFDAQDGIEGQPSSFRKEENIEFHETVVVGSCGKVCEIHGFALCFPKGALESEQKFAMTTRTDFENDLIDDMFPYCPILYCEPPTQFRLPVKIRAPLWLISNSKRLKAYYMTKDDTWVEIGRAKTVGQSLAEFSVDHFSGFCIFKRQSKICLYKLDAWAKKISLINVRLLISSEGMLAFVAYLGKDNKKKDSKIDKDSALFEYAHTSLMPKTVRCEAHKSIKMSLTCVSPDSLTFNQCGREGTLRNEKTCSFHLNFWHMMKDRVIEFAPIAIHELDRNFKGSFQFILHVGTDDIIVRASWPVQTNTASSSPYIHAIGYSVAINGGTVRYDATNSHTQLSA